MMTPAKKSSRLAPTHPAYGPADLERDLTVREAVVLTGKSLPDAAQRGLIWEITAEAERLWRAGQLEEARQMRAQLIAPDLSEPAHSLELLALCPAQNAQLQLALIEGDHQGNYLNAVLNEHLSRVQRGRAKLLIEWSAEQLRAEAQGEPSWTQGDHSKISTVIKVMLNERFGTPIELILDTVSTAFAPGVARTVWERLHECLKAALPSHERGERLIFNHFWIMTLGEDLPSMSAALQQSRLWDKGELGDRRPEFLAEYQAALQDPDGLHRMDDEAQTAWIVCTQNTLNLNSAWKVLLRYAGALRRDPGVSGPLGQLQAHPNHLSANMNTNARFRSAVGKGNLADPGLIYFMMDALPETRQLEHDPQWLAQRGHFPGSHLRRMAAREALSRRRASGTLRLGTPGWLAAQQLDLIERGVALSAARLVTPPAPGSRLGASTHQLIDHLTKSCAQQGLTQQLVRGVARGHAWAEAQA